MTESTEKGRTKRTVKRSDPRSMAQFIEELSWLLTSYSDLDFKALGKIGLDIAYVRNQRNLLAHGDRKPTVRMLVGVLPSVLVDEELFPANENIADFAKQTLDMVIPRWAKKSRYELIGHVVCHTDQSPPGKLDTLLTALERITDSKGSARSYAEKQIKSGATWNEVIQTLIAR